MNARPNLARIDELGQRLADQAFRTLISLCPEIRSASPARQEAVCAAMRTKVAPAIDRLLEDARLAPCLAEAAFHNAVLTLALAGVEALQAKVASPKFRATKSPIKPERPVMPSMSITIERTPLTLQWEGQEIQVEQLGIRLPFARKPENLKDMSASGDYLVYVTETRTMTPEEFDGFAANLLVSRDWLAGKGGYVGQGRLCVEVHAPGRPYLYVDPSGGDYARYAARLG